VGQQCFAHFLRDELGEDEKVGDPADVADLVERASAGGLPMRNGHEHVVARVVHPLFTGFSLQPRNGLTFGTELGGKRLAKGGTHGARGQHANVGKRRCLRPFRQYQGRSASQLEALRRQKRLC
jgi:hypothetical protein